MSILQEDSDILLSFTVQPDAKKDRIVHNKKKQIRIEVRACAERGEANEAVLSLLAKTFSKPVSDIVLIRGRTSRNKLVRIRNMTLSEFYTVLDLRPEGESRP